MSDFDHQSFLWKLDFLSAGRDKTPWLNALGISPGTTSRMVSGGQPPSIETLGRLQQVENASLRWLTTGRGQPYNTSRTRSDEETAALLDDLLAEAFAVHLLTTDAGGITLVLTLPAQIDLKDGRCLDYTVVEIIDGVVGSRTTARLLRAGSDGLALAVVPVSESTLQQVAGGQMGNPALLELLGRHGQPAAQGAAHVAEWLAQQLAKQGRHGGELTPAERALIETYRALDPDDQRRLEAISGAL